MKKKYVILIIIGMFLVIGGYFGYKSYLYFKYIPDTLKIKDEYINGLNIETITIKTETLNNDEYYKVNDIKIRNDFQNFELSDKFINDENTSGYILKENDIEKEPKVIISLGKSSYNFIETGNNSTSNSKEDKLVLEYLKENKIENDYDLFLHTIKNKNKNPNIFSSKKEMLAYSYSYTSMSIYPNTQKLTLIDGDLIGFIIEPKNLSVREVYLFDGIDKYVITFWNKDYFTIDYVKELLNTVVIDKQDEYTKIKINSKEMNIKENDYDTLVRILNKLNYQEITCNEKPMYIIEIGNKKYLYDRHHNKVVYNNQCAQIDGEDLNKSINILNFVYSDNEMNNIENVKMEIKEGTLTNKETTIIITDTNENHYQYNEPFRIDIKENGKWKEVDLIEEAVFNLPVYNVDKNNKLELNQNWEHIYGELSPGEYRLVKSTCGDEGCYESKYFGVEFTIE